MSSSDTGKETGEHVKGIIETGTEKIKHVVGMASNELEDAHIGQKLEDFGSNIGHKLGDFGSNIGEKLMYAKDMVTEQAKKMTGQAEEKFEKGKQSLSEEISHFKERTEATDEKIAESKEKTRELKNEN